jgi:hypothetical protein
VPFQQRKILPERKSVVVFLSNSRAVLLNAAAIILTTSPPESNIVLPGLTCRRSFVVISFVNCSVFCIGKAERFCRHEMNDEFYFATAKQIYRIMFSPQAKTLTLLDRLNAAHSDFNIDSLWWPVMAGVAAFA